MTEKEILAVYNSEVVRSMAANRFPDHHADIMQDLAIIMAKVELSGEDAIKYACRVLANLSKASRGKWAHRYEKLKALPEDFDLQEDLPPEVDPANLSNCPGLHWFHAGVFELFLKHGTIKEVSEATGIPQRTVSGSVKIARKKIKEAWQ